MAFIGKDLEGKEHVRRQKCGKGTILKTSEGLCPHMDAQACRNLGVLLGFGYCTAVAPKQNSCRLRKSSSFCLQASSRLGLLTVDAHS